MRHEIQPMKQISSILLIILFIAPYGLAQSVTIKGKVYSFCDNYNCFNALVYFDNVNGTICDTNGEFTLTVQKEIAYDTLNFVFAGLRKLFVLNIPLNKDTIDLGNIPLLCGFEGFDMTDFFCDPSDFLCQELAKEYQKNIEMNHRAHIHIINSRFSQYRFVLSGKEYEMSFNDNYSDLKMWLDLSKPLEK
jgi:hypothetical protein